MTMLLILLLLMTHPIVRVLPVHGSEAPSQHEKGRPSSIALVPFVSSSQHPTKRWLLEFAAAPSKPHHRHHHGREEPTHFIHPPTYTQQGPLLPPLHSPSPSTSSVSAAPTPSPKVLSKQLKKPVLHPATSPLGFSVQNNHFSPPPPILSLPLPPPNEDCTSVTCTEPLTYTPPGSACGCVWPIQVKLSLDVALYTFFPLASELGNEITASVSLYPHQVRVMGANAAIQQAEKTIVLINLVPLGENFDSATAFLIYEKFWHKQVSILTPLFGAYEVLSVSYPGLPTSTHLAPSNVYDGPYPGHGNNGMAMKPLGVDVRTQKRDGAGGRTIAIIALVSSVAFVACLGVFWLLLLKSGRCLHESIHIPNDSIPTPRKPSEAAASMMAGGRTSSTSMFLSSSVQACTGSAKTFSLEDIERATENFDDSRIIGEGGFGLVYSGTLDDGREVAVKVLKRDDQQGNREFLAEVEMLSRLHHRNLVKLIGICIEDRTRCLVYELVPNGSVESHLHGVDKTESRGWGTRMKIALGAARGLAYLHEDSSPCVIHRDFKSSNILLEHDFTPKVSDFGLARTAMDEENKHISTHVMGTFGYLAPEYAMTGHLLVKSDVYSYGVVLLELLTGRKPVDLSQPSGQENLVAWARPLLTSMDGLKTIVDPLICSNTSLDSITKVAAIASMCVQPEVSHRPFMGEVVQALKLVCNEFDETKEEGLRNCSQENFSTEIDEKLGSDSGEHWKVPETHHTVPGHDTCFDFDAKKVLPTTDFGSRSLEEGWDLGPFRRPFNSGPLATEEKQ